MGITSLHMRDVSVDPTPLATDAKPIAKKAPDQPTTHHRLLAYTLTLGELGAQFAGYWIERSQQVTDWRLGWNLHSWYLKTLGQFNSAQRLEGTSMDNDQWNCNFINHPFVGTLSYDISRFAGQSAAESAANSLFWGVAWEYLGEFKEKPSHTDMIVTGSTGSANGESIYRLYTDGGRFSLSSRLGASRNDAGWQPATELTASGETDDDKFPALLRLSAGLTPRGGTAPNGLDNASVLAKSSIFGKQWNNVTRVGGVQKGTRLFLGQSAAYDAESSMLRARQRADRFGITNVSATADLRVYKKDFAFHGAIDAGPSFSLNDGFAFSDWSKTNSTAGIKTELRDHGYYFGAGGTLRARSELTYRGLKAGAEFQYDHVDSIDDDDQNQAQVTNDFHLRDTRLKANLHLGAAIGDWDLQAYAGLDRRWGKAADTTTATATELSLGVGLSRDLVFGPRQPQHRPL